MWRALCGPKRDSCKEHDHYYQSAPQQTRIPFGERALVGTRLIFGIPLLRSRRSLDGIRLRCEQRGIVVTSRSQGWIAIKQGVLASAGSFEAEGPLQHLQPDRLYRERWVVAIVDGDRPLSRPIKNRHRRVNRKTLFVNPKTILHPMDAQKTPEARHRLRRRRGIRFRSTFNRRHAESYIPAEACWLTPKCKRDAIYRNQRPAR